MKISFQTQKLPGTRAQAMVEFALVLMVLMMVLVGILEVGRLLFIYAAVNNASREAARYASAIGLDTNPDTGVTSEKYKFCEMITNMAERSAFFTPLTVTITYDHGPNTGAFDTCNGTVDSAVSVNYGTDRVRVDVTADYNPMINLLPISQHTFTSSSARTIFGYLDLESPSSGGPSSGTTNTPTVTSTGTLLPPDTPTMTGTSTATQPGEVITMTPLPSNTPTLVPTITSTRTPTLTPTETSTPTLTFTPTTTPTAKPGCDSITTSSILFNSNVMSLSITNPHDAITVSNVQVTWNATGGPNSKTLTLNKISLANVAFWAGTASGGYFEFSPTDVTIPGNNQTSQIAFTFDHNYKTKSNAESIVITLSTPGCEGYTIHQP
jgi:Flp pilus assembly protein TadG